MNTGSNNTSSAASPATRAQSISRWACVLVSGVAVGITLTVFQVVHLKVSPSEQLIASMQHDDGQLMQERKVSDPLPRGLILDRAGRTLAIDSIGGLLYVDVRDLYRDTELRNERFAKLMANGKIVVENGQTYAIEHKLVDGKKVAERKQIKGIELDPIMALANELAPILDKPAASIAADIAYRPGEHDGEIGAERIPQSLRRLPESGELRAEDLAQLPRWVVLAKDMDDQQIERLKDAKEAGGPSSSLRGAHLLPKGDRERPYGVTGAALVGLTGRDTLLADLAVDVQALYRETAERNASGGEVVDDPIVDFAWSLSEAMYPDRPTKPTPTKEIARDLESKNKSRRKAAEAKMQTALAKWESEEAAWNTKASPMRDAVVQKLHDAVPMELRTLPTDAPLGDAELARLPKSVIVLANMERPQIHRIRAAKSLSGPVGEDRPATYPLLSAANVLSRKEGTIGLSGFERIAGNAKDGPLNSAEGYTTFVSAMNGAVISITPDGYKPGDAGKTVRLSIDIAIQEMVEKRVNETVKFSNAQGGRAVVVNSETGEILAAYSVLNPNTGREPIASDFAMKQKGMDESQKAALARMRWATDPFEPGSIFKPFVWAWALDNGIAQRNETLALPAGEMHVVDGKAHRVIREAHASSHGPKTWEQVLVKSVNAGMATIALRMGVDKMRTCLSAWGFGASTHTFGQMDHPELDCESSGIMPPVREWKSKTGALVSTSFGQGIGVTPLQVIHAFTAFCREGDMVPLTLQPIANDSLTGSTRVLSSNAVHETREVMEKVITEGTGKRLKDILEYRAFGKSGTAQLTSPNGGYLQGHHMSSFMVGAPFEKPQIAVLVTIEDPDEKKLGDAAFGGALAGPCSARIVNDVLGYLGVPPDNGGELVYDGKREVPQADTKVAAKPAAKKASDSKTPAKAKLASAAR